MKTQIVIFKRNGKGAAEHVIVGWVGNILQIIPKENNE